VPDFDKKASGRAGRCRTDIWAGIDQPAEGGQEA